MNATLVADGGRGTTISDQQLRDHLETITEQWILGCGVNRLLLLPPDHTRLHSQAGEIAAWFWERLGGSIDIDIMPTLGTHAAMTIDEWRLMYGERVPFERMVVHRWRDDLVTLGELSAAEMAEWSQNRFAEPMQVEVNRHVVSAKYDLVLSIGQVVPHEVIGFANYTKNVCIGAGGKDMIHKSHFLGAVSNMETIMGRRDNPVREAVDTAYSRFVEPQANVKFILTVVEDTEQHPELRGIFAGDNRECFEQACELSAQLNITPLETPISRCVVYLDPEEFKSTWLGNKAIYRTRMAMDDGGELVVLAPAVRMFGEDPEIDRLIRAHGYRGTESTLTNVDADASLAGNLSAAAHLIHGSSEGRFRITYCPGERGLSRAEIESVGYAYRPFDDAAADFGFPSCKEGWNESMDGTRFFFIRNPALGLWSMST